MGSGSQETVAVEYRSLALAIHEEEPNHRSVFALKWRYGSSFIIDLEASY